MTEFNSPIYFTFTSKNCRKLIVIHSKDSNEAKEKFKEIQKERAMFPFLYNKYIITATSTYLTGALL